MGVWERTLTPAEILTVRNSSASSLPNDLIGHWRLDRGIGSEAADSSNSGHNGVIDGATWFVDTSAPWTIEGIFSAGGLNSPVEFVPLDDGLGIVTVRNYQFPILVRNRAPDLVRLPNLNLANSGLGVTEGQVITIGAAQINGLNELWFNGTFGDGNIFPLDPTLNADSFLNMSPDATTVLDGALSYNGPAMNDRAGGILGDDFYGAAWIGQIEIGTSGSGAALIEGDVTFGTRSDDGSTLWIDLDQDGIFQVDELVVDNRGIHTIQNRVGSVNLTAGVYDIAIGFYEFADAELMEARFGQGVIDEADFFSLTIVDPSSPAQNNLWTPRYGARIEFPIMVGDGVNQTEVDRLVIEDGSLNDAQEMLTRFQVTDSSGRTRDISQASLSLNGTGAVTTALQLNQSATSGGATVETWVKPTASSGQRYVFDTAASSAGGWALFHDGSHWFIDAGAGPVETMANVEFGQWQHLAVVVDPINGATLYVNGATAVGYSTANVGTRADSGPLTIGADFSSQQSFVGGIDEFRVWSRPLTQAEIATAGSGHVAPTSPNLIGLWSFNEGAGDLAKDTGPVANNGEVFGLITPVAATASSFPFALLNPANLINGSGLALRSPISASAHTNGFPAGGVSATFWHTTNGLPIDEAFVQFDLGTNYTLDSMLIWQANPVFPGGDGTDRGVKQSWLTMSATCGWRLILILDRP